MTAHLCDANIWLALTLSGHVHHRTAAQWLGTIQGRSSIVFVRSVQQAYLRLLTTRAVQAPYGDPPLSDRAAWLAYDALASDERVVLRSDEPPGLDLRWRAYTTRDTASPKLWMDAWLAAFAVTASYRLVTTDRAFRQFDGLDLVLLGEASA